MKIALVCLLLACSSPLLGQVKRTLAPVPPNKLVICHITEDPRNLPPAYEENPTVKSVKVRGAALREKVKVLSEKYDLIYQAYREKRTAKVNNSGEISQMKNLQGQADVICKQMSDLNRQLAAIRATYLNAAAQKR